DDLFFGEISGSPQQKRPEQKGRIHHGRNLQCNMYYCITILIYAEFSGTNQAGFSRGNTLAISRYHLLRKVVI
ncbi:MAG: hypothetical protein ACLQDF_08655, partial [Desulfomonilia bacterium]